MDNKGLIAKVKVLINQNAVTVEDPISWIAAGVLGKSNLIFARDITSFADVRKGSILYPRSQGPEYAIIPLENAYLTLAFSLLRLEYEIVNTFELRSYFNNLLNEIKKNNNESFNLFIVENLTAVINKILDTKYGVNLKIKLILIDFFFDFLFRINPKLIENVKFSLNFQKEINNSTKELKYCLVNSLLKFDIQNLVNSQTSFFLFLIRKKIGKELIFNKFDQIYKEDFYFFINHKSFLLETGYIIPLTNNCDSQELNSFISFYAKLNNICYFDVWTEGCFQKLAIAIEQTKTLKIMPVKQLFLMIKRFFFSIKEQSDYSFNYLNQVLNCLKIIFDRIEKPKLATLDLYLLEQFPNPQYFLYEFNQSSFLPIDEQLISFDLKKDIKYNLKTIFGISSVNFKNKIKNKLYNDSFFYVDKGIFRLGTLKSVIQDKNFFLSLFDNFNSFSLSPVSYEKILRSKSPVEVQLKIEKSFNFLKCNYSDRKIFNFFKNEKCFLTLLDKLFDCTDGYYYLMQLGDGRQDKANILKLSKKNKTLDELHTSIFSKIAWLETENLILYKEDNPIWILNGFRTLDKRFTISVPKDSHSLIEFGYEMKNCIGGYINKIIRNECLVLNIYYKSKPYINIEIRNNKINEIKKKENKPVSQEELDMVENILISAKIINN